MGCYTTLMPVLKLASLDAAQVHALCLLPELCTSVMRQAHLKQTWLHKQICLQFMHTPTMELAPRSIWAWWKWSNSYKNPYISDCEA